MCVDEQIHTGVRIAVYIWGFFSAANACLAAVTLDVGAEQNMLIILRDAQMTQQHALLWLLCNK